MHDDGAVSDPPRRWEGALRALGESVANVEPVIGGMRGDAGLTGRGRQQAGLLEERLRTERFRADQLYVSTLPRALETGAYVAWTLQLSMQGDDDLQELRPGEADGLSVEEWRAALPRRRRRLGHRPVSGVLPGR